MQDAAAIALPVTSHGTTVWRNWSVTSAAGLPLTGERTVPGIAREGYWFARHEAVYRWAADTLTATVGPGDVLVDAGCGEGYGADFLGQALGALAVGLDYDEITAAHVRAAHPAVAAIRANLAAFPLASDSCAAVISLQVIEHLWDLAGFLAECRRVLAPNAALIVSTPNRPVFSPGLARSEKPTNPFHVEEFDAEQVWGMLDHAGFRQVEVLGLHHGARLQRWEAQFGPIVAAQVEAALSDHWPEELEAFVAGVRAGDFEFGDADGAADLIGIGWR